MVCFWQLCSNKYYLYINYGVRNRMKVSFTNKKSGRMLSNPSGNSRHSSFIEAFNSLYRRKNLDIYGVNLRRIIILRAKPKKKIVHVFTCLPKIHYSKIQALGLISSYGDISFSIVSFSPCAIFAYKWALLILQWILSAFLS